MSPTLDVRIQGESMWPTFHDGDVLTFSLLDGTPLECGDVVLVVHPFKPEIRMVKRVLSIADNGDLFLTGDNPDPLASEDSHNFGHVPQGSVEVRWVNDGERA